MDTPVIELDSVSKNYGDVAALQDLTLQVATGKITAVLGENGAGKTTLFNLILGRHDCQSGRVSVFGQLPGANASKAKIGAIMQCANLSENLTVAEQLTLFSAYYAAPLPVAKTIAMARLEGLENKRVGKLSGGQKQRLFFALAICGDPDLLLLDEPTVALDIASRQQFWQCLEQFKQQGKTILLCTHYLEEADQLADHILVLDKGNLISQTTPAELKARMSQKQVSFNYDGDLALLDSLLPTKVHSRDNRISFASARPELDLVTLFNSNITCDDLAIDSFSLEQAFLNLIQQQANNKH